MPWGRLDDSLYDHPKLDLLPVEARLSAVGLWARAISWCNRFLTDGHIPRARVEKLDGTVSLADQLVAAGLFDDDASGYVVHDFLAFNDSREAVLERRAKDAARKAEWRAKRDAKTGPNGTDSGTAPEPERGKERRHSGTDAGTPSVGGAKVTPGRTAGHGADASTANGVSQRDSRTRESRPDPTRPDLLNEENTPQPPASGGRQTRRQAAGPMRSPTRYDAELERDELDIFATPEPAEVTS